MSEMLFDEWNEEKQRIDGKTHKPPYVSVGDIWWVSIGQNVGTEMNGKSGRSSRPAVILKKLKYDFYLIAPTTTQEKSGTWYVPIHHNGMMTYVCLHQIRTIDYRRITSKLRTIDETELTAIWRGFQNLYP